MIQYALNSCQPRTTFNKPRQWKPCPDNSCWRFTPGTRFTKNLKIYLKIIYLKIIL